MTTPSPEHRSAADQGVPAPLLEYRAPSARDVGRRVSRVAVAALVTGAIATAGVLLMIYDSMRVSRFLRTPAVEVLCPVLALVGIGLSLDALLRTADPAERVTGDRLAWAALLLNIAAGLVGGCCGGFRLAEG
jgi:chromate transport protein ChrA